jgi:C-terminal processing protease CtpA/Prc
MYYLYYWNRAVEDLTPSTFSVDNFKLPAQEFLTTIIESLDWNMVQDKTENPPTIDGTWNAERTEREHIYSNIQPADYTRAGTYETSFGFGIDYFLNETSTAYEAVVSWVQPDGPADEALLKRGTVIEKYADGNATPASLSGSAMQNFYYHIYGAGYYGGSSMTLVDKDGVSYTFSHTTGPVSPIIGHEMITSPGGRKVAYFAYSSFVGGSRRTEGGDFRGDMRTIFGEFKNSGAQDLVLDLRYNGGGEVSACKTLTSLIGDVDESLVFGKMLRNENWREFGAEANPEIEYFANEPNSLRLPRVYCLMTKNSASASILG